MKDYIRYWRQYRGKLEALDIAGLPCNKWVLKLASHYLSWLGLVGGSFDVIAAKREELRLKTRSCSGVIEKREVECGLYISYSNGWRAVIQRAVLYSGVRAKHLWLLSRARPIYEDDHLVVYDLRRSLGYKRVNVVVLPKDLAESVLAIIGFYAYKTAQKGFKPPVRCFRRYHWNLCLKATGDRTLCGFIQGRWRSVDLAHYEEYVWSSVEAQLATWRFTKRFEAGASLRELLSGRALPETLHSPEGKVSAIGLYQTLQASSTGDGLLPGSNLLAGLKYYPSLGRVEPGTDTRSLGEPDGLSECPRYRDEVLESTLGLLRLYSQRLG